MWKKSQKKGKKNCIEIERNNIAIGNINADKDDGNKNN